MIISAPAMRLFGTLAVASGMLALLPGDGTAQSLFAGRGLGYAAEPLDGRARALGGVGLGLPEGGMSFMNPAGISAYPAPTLHVTLQPDRFSADLGTSEMTGGTVRFPLIHVVLPYRRWAASVGYASYLDRNWAVQRDTVLHVDGSDLGVIDRFASHGGVARLRFGGSFDLTPRLSIGAALDRYTGSANDSTYREFTDAPMRPAIESNAVTFGGLGYGLGLRWVPSGAFAAGASLTAGGRLEVDDADPLVASTSYELPLQAALGASGRVTPTTLVALSAGWAGWSSVEGMLPGQGASRDTWTLGAGIEWEALRAGTSVVPLRVGYRRTELPFRWDSGVAAGGWADERAFTFGGGLRLGGGAALLDAAADRGQRGGAELGITESFWRFSLSLTVLGR
jgi:hypothetical protein